MCYSDFFFLRFLSFWLCWVFVAMYGLFSRCGECGLLFIAVPRLLVVVASLVAEHRPRVHGFQLLQCVCSVVVARGL